MVAAARVVMQPLQPRPPKSSKARRGRSGKKRDSALVTENEQPTLIAALKLGCDLAEVFRVARPELASSGGGERSTLTSKELVFPESVEAASRTSVAGWTGLLVRSARASSRAPARRTASAGGGGRKTWKSTVDAAVRQERDRSAPTTFVPSLLRPLSAPLDRPPSPEAAAKHPKPSPHAFPEAVAFPLPPYGASDSESDGGEGGGEAAAVAERPSGARPSSARPSSARGVGRSSTGVGAADFPSRPLSAQGGRSSRPTLQRQASVVEYSRGSARRRGSHGAIKTAPLAKAAAAPEGDKSGGQLKHAKPFVADVRDAIETRALSPRPAVLASCAGDGEALDLRNAGLGDEYAPIVAGALPRRAAQLLRLDVAWNRLGPAALALIARALPGGVEHVDVSGNRGAKAFGPALAEDLGRPLRLASFVCRDGDLRDEGCAQAVDALLGFEGASFLTRLDLGRNAIGDRGCAAVGALLKADVAPLAHLSLDVNSITSDGAAHVLKPLSLTRDAARPHTLVTLDLGHNRVGSPGVAVELLAATFKENTVLAHVSLAANRLTRGDVEALSLALAQNDALLGLHLEGNHAVVDARGYVHWTGDGGDVRGHNRSWSPPVFVSDDAVGLGCRPPRGRGAGGRRSSPSRTPRARSSRSRAPSPSSPGPRRSSRRRGAPRSGATQAPRGGTLAPKRAPKRAAMRRTRRPPRTTTRRRSRPRASPR